MEAKLDAVLDGSAPDRSRWYGWYAAVLVACAAVASALVYARLPASAALHWNAAWQADQYGSPLNLALKMPLVMIGIIVLARLLPTIDPLRANYDKFRPTYRFVVALLLTLLLAIHLIVLAVGLGVAVPIDRIAPAGAGILLVMLGNVLPRARRNWLLGIRTPWTLSSDRVWERTHRVGGYVMIVSGIAMLIALFVADGPANRLIFSAIGITAAGVCVVYSYAAWRQESHQ